MTLESQLISISNWFNAHPLLGFIALAWALVWKGFALWKAAQLQQKYWFGIILVANTFGILEIIYLFFVAKKYNVEVIES
jgi:hypothetical protein